EVLFSIVHLRAVIVAVAFLLSTAWVASVNVLMNTPAGRPDALSAAAGVAPPLSDTEAAKPLIGWSTSAALKCPTVNTMFGLPLVVLPVTCRPAPTCHC